jgi:gluconolactonase
MVVMIIHVVSRLVSAIIVSIDERFGGCVSSTARLDHLYDGCRWAEGPAWFPAHRSLVWSDIPNDRMLRWDEVTGAVGEFRSPAGFSNGNTLDGVGRLVTCEHGNRRVTRTEADGAITVIADAYEGKRLNSPNDVVVKSDGSIWFTDPSYGIASHYEGHRAEPEYGGCFVFRVDASGAMSVVADDFDRPNGLAFTPDESRLFVADSGAPRHMRVFDVGDDGGLSGGDVFSVCSDGIYDGFRFDEDGRLWTSAADGVHCFDQDGTLLGKVLVPEVVANVCFGGARRNRLFICATTSLYAVHLGVVGVSPCRG